MRTDHVLALNRHFETATLPAIDAAIAECEHELKRLYALREIVGMALATEKVERTTPLPFGADALKTAMARADEAEQAERMEAAE